MAAAIEAEKRHQSVPRAPSPLEGLIYEADRGEHDLFRYIDSPTDDRIESIVEDVLAKDADVTTHVRSVLTQSDLYTILTFGRRRALAALRQGSPQPVRAGFHALALIDLERIDWRDAAVAAGLLAYAGQRTGAPIHSLVSEVSRRCQSAMTEVLTRHSSTPTNGLAVGGYREISTSAGVGLAQDYGHRYEPTVDLVSIAEGIVMVVEADHYRVDHITTGSDLPVVWLPAANAATTRARNRIRGCLSVSARPTSDNHAMAQQMFAVWLAEAASPIEASTIAAAAVPKAGSGIAILGLASGPVCAVMVARSVVKEVPPVEDSKSLERFRLPLQRLIGS